MIVISPGLEPSRFFIGEIFSLTLGLPNKLPLVLLNILNIMASEDNYFEGEPLDEITLVRIENSKAALHSMLFRKVKKLLQEKKVVPQDLISKLVSCYPDKVPIPRQHYHFEKHYEAFIANSRKYLKHFPFNKKETRPLPVKSNGKTIMNLSMEADLQMLLKEVYLEIFTQPADEPFNSSKAECIKHVYLTFQEFNNRIFGTKGLSKYSLTILTGYLVSYVNPKYIRSFKEHARKTGVKANETSFKRDYIPYLRSACKGFIR